MKVNVVFTPAEAAQSGGRDVAVVIDVLRATSTMVEALVNGAQAIIPVADVDDAVRRADELGRDNVLLCGERCAERIRGFDFGNSPLEFTRERVAGRTLIMTTTNGTRAFLANSNTMVCLAGSFLNARAVAQRVADRGEDVVLVCAGREGAFALEDAVCAGRIARYIRELGVDIEGNDALGAAIALSRRAPSARLLLRTAAGRRLVEIGHRGDVEFCAIENRHDAVPILDEHRIRL